MTYLLQHHRPESLVAFAGAGPKSSRELETCAHAIALKLQHTQVGKSVVLACGDRYFFAAGLLAAWSRGLRVVLPSNGQDDTVHRLMSRVNAAELLHDRDQSFGLDVRKADTGAANNPERLRIALAREDTAVVAFTSGSTGEPQGHEKSLAQLLEETLCLVKHFELADCRVLSAVPAHHIYGLLFGVLVPLCAGGALSRNTPLLPSDLLACAERERADVLVAVPPHLRSLAQDDGWTHQPFRRVFSSGGPLAADVSCALAGRGMMVTEVLGSTETGGVAFRDLTHATWTPLPGVHVSADPGGTMHVASPWLSAKVAQPMATQDRIKMVEGGFEHLGRSDGVVKVGGRRVDLGELETKLRAIPGVRDARVLAQDGDAVRGTMLLAVVEAEAITSDELRQSLTVSVDPVVIPRRFRVVAKLPRNAAGKVTRDALLALFDTWTFPLSAHDDGRVEVNVPASLGFFRGHFAGDPILPGVVQLRYLALAEARKRWPELGAVRRITRVKFKRPILPGETLTLTLSRKRPELVQYALSCGDELSSSGLLHFGSPATSGAVHE